MDQNVYRAGSSVLVKASFLGDEKKKENIFF